jgi:LemA protein
MVTGIIIGVVVVVILLFVWSLYNSVIRLNNEVKNSWAQIDVQLKRRYDLIPNLIETVKGYAKHEKSVFTDVTKARTAFMNAGSMGEKAKASNMMTDTLKSLFAVAENYPDLKANENFLQLQEELSGTENKIAYARQHYNDVVMIFNNRIQTFPSNIFASIFGFTAKENFEVPAKEKENIKVKF